MLIFQLKESFIEEYKNKDPMFGFNGLGLLTYYRTYSRIKPDGTNEQWFETVRRVVEGTYTIQKQHIINSELGWNDNKAQQSAQDMYDRIFNMKFLPPGRMLWALGTPLIHERKIGQALFNCAFVSTEKMGDSLNEAIKPFIFMMDMSMVGVGVGFDLEGERRIKIKKPGPSVYTYHIPDTREGWVKSLDLLLESYFCQHFNETRPAISFNYEQIRDKGQLIKGFGGIASGPDPLIHMHKQIKSVLDKQVDKDISVSAITDLMNMIGQCVVAGNVRRTAQIALGPDSHQEYRKLKDYRWCNEERKYKGKMAHRAAWGWASNNSVMVDFNSDFNELTRQTAVNGEPGFVFLENIRKFSRLCDKPDYKDARACGTNPCGEQTLESYELCCLVETFPSKAESKEDYLRTLKFAYLLGKTATLVNTTWQETNRVQKRNRRIGTSVSGVTNFLESKSLDELKIWLEAGYNEIQKWDSIYSSWLCVPRSIKTTSVKPSGTVSLLAGVNPGCHFPEFNYYLRRVRISKMSSILRHLLKSGLTIEDDYVDPSSVVVEFPIHCMGRSIEDVTIWEQVALAVFLQKYWSDNQVSCTATFKKHEAPDLAHILDHFKYELKAISFLPKLEAGSYAQMPYEQITKNQYLKMIENFSAPTSYECTEDGIGERYCNNDTCTV